MKTVDFSETIEAYDLKVGRYRHYEVMLVLMVKVISLPYIFPGFVCFVLY